MTPRNNNTPKIQSNLFDSSFSITRKPQGPSAGGKVMAERQHREAVARYNANPKYCKQCGELLVPHDEYHLQEVRRRNFCDRSCSAKFNNKGKRRHPVPSMKPCEQCGEMFIGKRSISRFCSRRCSAKYTSSLVTPEEHLRRGFGDSVKSSHLRRKQLTLEEGIAESLREDGWEIFSPTVVCDRVGVKNGKVFFLEFKPINKQRLRPGQRRIADLVPEMYQIIAR